MEYETPPPQTNKSSNTLIIVVVVALVLLIAAAIGGYFYGKSVKEQEQKAAQETSLAELEQVKATAAATLLAPPKTTTETTCNTDELSLTVQEGSGTGAGTLSYDLIFTNTGSRTCALFGYPGVSFVNSNGNIVGEPANRVANAPEAKLSLAPNTKVKAPISVSNQANFTNGECKTGATKLRVYPPNDVGYLSVTSPVTAWCPNFQVWPVQAL
ncbi:MAG TPA: DUF4232 domain-containing protein [Candidatus Saccharimonadales bacterium]|nr:DUF4232 domain-containing protein [Candidatus Saccharimonadales bacterium]